MILITHKKIDLKFWDAALVIISIVLFLPVLLTVYCAHTDGLFIMSKKGNWLGDIEAGIMFMQGRPLGAFANSFIGWFIHKTEDLTWLRVATFILTMASSRLILHIARRENMEPGWSYLLAFFFILLPGNLLHVIWVANGIPESLGLLCGILSYYLFYHPKLKPFVMRLIMAASFFLIGLLMYQPMAVIVFGLIYIKVLWRGPMDWPSVRIGAIKDISFYAALMSIYWVLVKLIILPLGYVLGLVPTTWPMYKMVLAGMDINKFHLAVDSMKYGLMGTWDPLMHGQGLIESILVLIGLAGVTVMIFLDKPAGPKSFVGKAWFFQKGFVSGCLFICANAPSLMAVNCKEVIGYRTLLPTGFMGLVIICFIFRNLIDAARSSGARNVLSFLIMAYVLASLSAASWTIDQNVYNDLKTYLYVDARARMIDYNKVEKVYLRYSSPIWRAFHLPFEMGYTPAVFNYIFDKYSASAGRSVGVYDTFIDWPLFLDKRTDVVDFEFLSNKDLAYGDKVYIFPTAGTGQEVFVTEDFNQLSKYPTLDLKQREIDGRILDFWRIPALIWQGFIYVHFIGHSDSLISYSLDADCRDAKGRASFFDVKWQGLGPDKQWVDISGSRSALGETRIDQVVGSKAYSYLRLVLIKRMSVDTIFVKDMKLISYSG